MASLSVYRFFRHAQSAANAGSATSDPTSILLTERGHRQAEALSLTFEHAPDLIISSPFLRAQQSAAPTRVQFPAVKFEIWSTQEFTYLAPARCTNSSAEQRRPWVQAYWKAAEPKTIDGEGAESFADFIGRVRRTIAQLEGLHALGFRSIVLFGHGQFWQAVRWLLREPEINADANAMHAFHALEMESPIHNCAFFTATFDGRTWGHAA